MTKVSAASRLRRALGDATGDLRAQGDAGREAAGVDMLRARGPLAAAPPPADVAAVTATSGRR
jgi:hypothetical protein